MYSVRIFFFIMTYSLMQLKPAMDIERLTPKLDSIMDYILAIPIVQFANIQLKGDNINRKTVMM